MLIALIAGAASVATTITASFDQAVPLQLTATASVQVTASLDKSFVFAAGFSSTASVQVTASLDKSFVFAAGFLATGTTGQQYNASFDQPVPLQFSSYVQVNPGTATREPDLRVAPISYFSNTGADITPDLPLDLWPGDRVLFFGSGPSAAVISQTVGPTVTGIQNLGQAGNAVALYEFIARSSTDGTQSQDAGATFGFHLNQSEPWTMMMVVVQNGHEVAGAFYHLKTSTLAAQGSDTIVASGGATPPVLAHAMQLTFVGYGQQNNNNTNTLPSTATVSGGGTDALVGQVNTSSAAGKKNHGAGLYRSATAPTAGTVVPTRTVQLVTTANKAALNAITLTLIPSTGGAGARFWNVPSMITMSDPVLNRMDVLMPDDANGGLPFQNLLDIHGGGANGDKGLEVGHDNIILRYLQRGRAIVSMNYRTAAADPAFTGAITAVDIHGTARCLRGSLAAAYGLNPARVVAIGGSFGATALNVTAATPNKTGFFDAAQGHPTESEEFDAMITLYGEIHFAAVDPNFTALGITRTSLLPACNTSSVEAQGVVGSAALPYALCVAPRFDAILYPMTGAPAQDATLNTFNKGCAAFLWDGRATWLVAPHTLIAAGTDDHTVPYYQNDNPQESAAEKAMPPGLYQIARANGVPTIFEKFVGAPHGMSAVGWWPSVYVGATNGAQVDRIVEFGVLESGTQTIMGMFDRPVPLQLTASGTASTAGQITGALNKAVPLSLASTASVQVTASFDHAVPLTLTATGSVTNTASFNNPVPLGLVATGTVNSVLTLYVPALTTNLPRRSDGSVGLYLDRYQDPMVACPIKGTVYDTDSFPGDFKAFGDPGVVQILTQGGADAAFATALLNSRAMQDPVIEVAPGIILTGLFTFPVNTLGSWLEIRSTEWASFTPRGVYFDPIIDGPHCFILQTQNTPNAVAITFAANAAKVRLRNFIGRITNPALSTTAWAQVTAGVNGPYVFAERPQDVVFEKGTVDAADITTDAVRGFAVQGDRIAFLDCDILKWHSTNKEAQGISSVSGVRQLKMVNCRMQAAGEPFFLGGGLLLGGDPIWVPEDIEMRRCILYGYPEDGSSIAFVGKNLAEVKSVRRLCWVDSVFRKYREDGQNCTWSFKVNWETAGGGQGGQFNVTEDLTLWFCHLQDVAGWLQIIGKESSTSSFPDQPVTRLDMRFVLVDRVDVTGSPYRFIAGGQRLMEIANGATDIVMDHITIAVGAGDASRANILMDVIAGAGSSVAAVRLTMTNSVYPQLLYGIHASTGVEGTGAFAICSTVTWAKNLLYRRTGGSVQSTYPAGTLYAASQSAALPGYLTGDNNVAPQYRAGTPNQATDGLDLGAIPTWVLARTGEVGVPTATITASFNKAVPLALAASASVTTTASFNRPVPITLSASGSTLGTITATFDRPVPLILLATGSTIGAITASFDQPVPLRLLADASVSTFAAITASFDQPIPLIFASATAVGVQHTIVRIRVAPRTGLGAKLRITPIHGLATMPTTFDLLIDCSMDFDPDIDVEQKSTATGLFEPFAGLSSVTMVLSDVRGGISPIDASLQRDSAERSGVPGRLHPSVPFDVDDLQVFVLPFANEFVFLNLFMDGELVGEPLRVLVRADRLGWS